MKVQAIIPTAGVGKRLNAATPKPLISLYGKPLFIYTLEAFERSDLIESIIVVTNDEVMSEIEKKIKQYKIDKVTKIVLGGKERSDSVKNGLDVVDMDTDVVVIHDGARPLIETKLIEESITACEENDSVVTAVKIKPTIKRINVKDMIVEETIDRDRVWEIQTPQVFKTKILREAHATKKDKVATDDAALVESIGCKVRVVEGDYKNIKVTTQEDLIVAEAFLDKRRVPR